LVLWGSSARSKRSLIHDRHNVIESAHPSALSAHRGFFGSRVFSQINQHLARHRFTAIDWRLPE
ncbi:MAG: uracil-DNA glycosylase, partial [Ilumatobacteraceae bacterium]